MQPIPGVLIVVGVVCFNAFVRRTRALASRLVALRAVAGRRQGPARMARYLFDESSAGFVSGFADRLCWSVRARRQLLSMVDGPHARRIDQRV